MLTDTPYNTYTREGLPPTPIAMPGRAALMAAVQPASTQALYFVARGDGSSHFSQTLGEHNRAVHQYQRPGSRSSDGNGKDKGKDAAAHPPAAGQPAAAPASIPASAAP